MVAHRVARALAHDVSALAAGVRRSPSRIGAVAAVASWPSLRRAVRVAVLHGALRGRARRGSDLNDRLFSVSGNGRERDAPGRVGCRLGATRSSGAGAGTYEYPLVRAAARAAGSFATHTRCTSRRSASSALVGLVPARRRAARASRRRESARGGRASSLRRSAPISPGWPRAPSTGTGRWSG